MQNSKRRRGISLSHHQNNSTLCQTQLDRSVYVEPQSTRMQYSRYPMQQAPSRHASAPKTKVQFSYPTNFQPTGVATQPSSPFPKENYATPRQQPVESTIKYHILGPHQKSFNRPVPRHHFAHSITKGEITETKVIQEENKFAPIQQAVDQTYKIEITTSQDSSLQSTSIAAIHFPVENVSGRPKDFALENIPQKYVSFQQCKETIGKRLFGAGSIKRKDNALQESDRSNRWLQEATQTAFSQTSVDECIKESKAKQPVTSSHRKLQIQREVVTYVAESKISKQNIVPSLPSCLPPKKQVKRSRDPQKLQQMEKRLMEIIKICDQNLC